MARALCRKQVTSLFAAPKTCEMAGIIRPSIQSFKHNCSSDNYQSLHAAGYLPTPTLADHIPLVRGFFCVNLLSGVEELICNLQYFCPLYGAKETEMMPERR